MKINVSISALENLIAQILADNAGQTLTAAQFTAGAPTVYDIPEDDRNTEITLTAVEGQGYTGSVAFHYTRLDLNSGVAVPVTSVQVASGDDMAASLAKAAAAMGLIAEEIDGSDFTAPVDDQTPGSLTLTPKATSLVYVGAPVTIALTVPAETDPAMGDTFTTTDLNGFEPETVA